eukprot:COSAG01_NODE_3318_length_6272_cov_2.193261_7_plen_124_part_00
MTTVRCLGREWADCVSRQRAPPTHVLPTDARRARRFRLGGILISVDGTPKPAFRAFELLHEAGEHVAPISEISASSAAPAGGPAGARMATKQLGAAADHDCCAVTAFVTVEPNDLGGSPTKVG